MPKIRALVFGLAGAALASTALIADSHADLHPAVKARQAQMSLYAFNLGALGAMAKGEVDYDAEAAQGAASNLVALSTLAAGPMWAPGTDDMSVEGTRALATAWENMEDIMAKGTAMAEAASAMADAAGTDLASLQAAMGPLGGACSECHKAYRAPE